MLKIDKLTYCIGPHKYYKPILITFMSNLQIFSTACHFAALKHKDQRRKNAEKTPYINHPLEVASFLSEHGVDCLDALCAAVLHDTIEDTETTKEDLIMKFGENVCSIVLECSDDKSIDKVERKKLQVTRAKHASLGARLVKLGDKWSNINSLLMSPPTWWSRERIRGYVIWSCEVCRNACFENTTGFSEHPIFMLDTIWKKLVELFEKFSVFPCAENSLELEKYYTSLANNND